MNLSRRHTLAVALLALALVALGLGDANLAPARASEPAGADPDRAAPDRATPVGVLSEWTDCSEDQGIERLTCAWLDVPLDHANPDGQRIQLRVSRIDHTSSEADYKGFIVLNPGGPGGDGVWTPLFSTWLPYGAEDYDWVGFDPRGAAQSVPRLSCDTGYWSYDRPPYVPRTRTIMRQWLQRTRGYAEDCARSEGAALLEHLTTRDLARDLEALRAALQAERPAAGPKLNFYGLSFGTYLGQVYATLYPGRVGRFLFDSVVNPRRLGWGFQLDQDRAFDPVINSWFRWIARNDDVYHLGTEGRLVRAAYYRRLNRLDEHPAAGGRLGPAEFQESTVLAGYARVFWADLAAAYSKFMRGEGGADLLAWSGSTDEPTDDSAFAIYNAVMCTDTTAWPAWPQIREDAWRVHERAPWGTWSNTWYSGPCRRWPAPARTPVDVDGDISPQILLVSETYDAATPFRGALKVRSIFPTASLIEGVGGSTHTGSLLGVPCVDNAIADFFATGAVPPRQPGRTSDLQCPPVRAADPSAAARTELRPGAGTAWQRYRVLHPALR